VEYNNYYKGVVLWIFMIERLKVACWRAADLGSAGFTHIGLYDNTVELEAGKLHGLAWRLNDKYFFVESNEHLGSYAEFMKGCHENVYAGDSGGRVVKYRFERKGAVKSSEGICMPGIVEDKLVAVSVLVYYYSRRKGSENLEAFAYGFNLPMKSDFEVPVVGNRN